MRRILFVTCAFACLLTSPIFAQVAADVPAATESVAPTVAAPTGAALEAEIAAARTERLQRTELAARMDAVIEASKKALAGLQATINATTDPTMLKDLEGRMAQLKTGTTLELLRVQATFARETGRIEQADAIDLEIDRILHPKRAAATVTTTDASRRAAVPAGGAR